MTKIVFVVLGVTFLMGADPVFGRNTENTKMLAEFVSARLFKPASILVKFDGILKQHSGNVIFWTLQSVHIQRRYVGLCGRGKELVK